MSVPSPPTPPGDPVAPVGVAVRVRVEFAGNGFMIREFTTHLGVAGAFIATTSPPALGSQGRLTFRYSRWEKPFTVAAEVVRVVGADAATEESPAGTAVNFVDVEPGATEQLRRLVAGFQVGSVTEAIRRAVRSGSHPLLEELRRRPADQKVIFAMAAQGPEIDHLIHDGHPAAVSRLLDNPRLGKNHLNLIVKDVRTPPRILLLILRNTEWMADEETRLLLCRHPLTPLPHVLRLLGTLPASRVKELANLATLRQAIRTAARQLLNARK